MNRIIRVAVLAAAIPASFLIVPPAHAGMWDEPSNLEALPKDISADELRATMRAFAGSTGSRCSTCHVYEVETDLRTYDFAADDKEKKQKAREMIRLVAEINASIDDKLGLPGSSLVNVNCATCHRGLPKPEMIQDVIKRTWRQDGVPGAVAEYRQLRDRYYGDYAFDFSPRSLMVLAEDLAGSGEAAAAIDFLDLNLEFYPTSARTLVLKARIQGGMGDKAGARQSLEKALELEPDNQWTKQLLDQLNAS